MKRWLLAVVLAAMPAMAQQANDPIEKIVQLKHADTVTMRNLVRAFGVSVVDDHRLRVLIVSGPRSRVTTAEEAIKQLDVPSAAHKDIELTVYFVVGDDEAPHPGLGTIPPDLQSTVSTLKGTFPFKAYHLLDTLTLRTRSGTRSSATGQLSGGRFTSFHVASASTEGDGTTIRLEGLHAGLRVPHTSAGKTDFVDTGLTSEVISVKEGQKLVVGRSSLNGPSRALFLVLIAKIVN